MMINLPPATCHLPPTRRNGQTALSFVFLIGIIVVSMGATLAFLASSFLATGYGFQAANQAFAVASAGAQDAMLQLKRNKDFSSSGYSVPVDSDTATVTVMQNSPLSGQAKIISSATVFFRQRKLQVVASVNASTSMVSVISWQLLTL